MASNGDVSLALHLRSSVRRWRVPFASLPFDDSPGSPWLLVTPEVREAFDLVRRAGPSLDQSSLGPPLLGVKCGCNDAFVVTLASSAADPAESTTDHAIVAIRGAHPDASDRRGLIERALLRPVVRGESIKPWRVVPTTAWIIWTHGDGDSEVNTPRHPLPAHAAAWLENWRYRLAARSDLQHQSAWWSLFRTPSASSSATRVVWSDLGRRPRAAVLAAGDPSVPLNSCYVVRAADRTDAQALAVLLNSGVAAAWLNVIAEPAANDYRRYLAWTVGLLPVPRDWSRARALLAPIERAAAAGAPPDDEALTAAVADAYALPAADLQPLLTWTTW